MIISTTARPTRTNRSTSFLEIRDKHLAAFRAFLMDDEIEIDAKLDKRQNSADQIGSWPLLGRDKVRLCIQDYNEVKKAMKVSKRLTVIPESSWSPQSDERTLLKTELNKILLSPVRKSVSQSEHPTPSTSASGNRFKRERARLSTVDRNWSRLKGKYLIRKYHFS